MFSRFLYSDNITRRFLVLPGQEPDYAGRTEFTVDLRIPAGQAFITEIDVVFQTEVAGFTIWMIDASSHGGLSSQDLI